MVELNKLQAQTIPIFKTKKDKIQLKNLSDKQWFFYFILTLLGFLIAIAANKFIRQMANVEIKTYMIFGIPFTFNT